MPVNFELTVDTLAGLCNNLQPLQNLGCDPLCPDPTDEELVIMVFDPCTGNFVVPGTTPVGPPCEEDLIVDLANVPVDLITAEGLGAFAEQLTADSVPTATLLMAGTSCQQLAEHHRTRGNSSQHESLTVTAERLFSEAIRRLPASG